MYTDVARAGGARDSRQAGARPRAGLRILGSVLALSGLSFVAGCASTPSVPDEPARDPLLVQYDASARAAVAEGRYDRAARFYELALGRARTADLGLEVAKAAYNQGACLLMMQRPAAARVSLQEAASEFERLKRDPSPAWLLEARAARLLGDNPAAAERVDRVMAVSREDDVRLQGWLIKGSMAVEAGQLDAARQALSKARALLRDDPALRAGVASLSGQLALAEQRAADAALHFDKEAAFLQRAARWSDMAAALRRAGEAYQRAEQHGPAAQRFFRAARSFYGQGQLVPALQAMEWSVEAAGRSGDEALARDTGRLLGEIRQAVEAARADVPAE